LVAPSQYRRSPGSGNAAVTGAPISEGAIPAHGSSGLNSAITTTSRVTARSHAEAPLHAPCHPWNVAVGSGTAARPSDDPGCTVASQLWRQSRDSSAARTLPGPRTSTLTMALAGAAPGGESLGPTATSEFDGTPRPHATARTTPATAARIPSPPQTPGSTKADPDNLRPLTFRGSRERGLTVRLG